MGASSNLDLNDEGLRTALILGSEDLGPVGGKLQLQMEDQGEGELCLQSGFLIFKRLGHDMFASCCVLRLKMKSLVCVSYFLSFDLLFIT